MIVGKKNQKGNRKTCLNCTEHKRQNKRNSFAFISIEGILSLLWIYDIACPSLNYSFLSTFNVVRYLHACSLPLTWNTLTHIHTLTDEKVQGEVLFFTYLLVSHLRGI